MCKTDAYNSKQACDLDNSQDQSGASLARYIKGLDVKVCYLKGGSHMLCENELVWELQNLQAQLELGAK